MKRTQTKTSYEVPGWFRVLMATFCLAVFYGGAWFVSNLDCPRESEDRSNFSSEAPASYLRSPLAYADGETYLDGRGRRFDALPHSDDSFFIATSHKKNEENLEESSKTDEIALDEQGADFLDELEENVDAPLLAVDPQKSQETIAKTIDDAPSFAELGSPDLSSPGWRNDELDCDVKDLRAEWDNYEASAKLRGSSFDGADFDEQFDQSLVTADLFRTNSTTAFFGETNAKDGNAPDNKHGIAQVSAVAPAQLPRVGRYVSQGAVGGSGDVIIQIY